MNSFIEFFPALNGDSILIKLDDYFMLIDGGYVNTYNKFIKPKLLEINSENKPLNHIVVTHIDRDHISGIVNLIKENRGTPFIKIENIWHNSFKHIKDFNPKLNFKGKSVSNFKTGYALSDNNQISEQDISAIQGSTLASELYQSNIKWNAEFDDKAISIENNLSIQLAENITLKLLSPSNQKLRELNLYWKKELYQKGYATSESIENFSEDAFETVLANQKDTKVFKSKNISLKKFDVESLSTSVFHEDNASANGSSIAFVIEKKDVKVLFLGDSHPSQIVESLELHYNAKDFPIEFDVIKISHHGSQKNTSNELLEIIGSKKYVFSTNGKIHNHPDRETIARIITKETGYTKELYFTYQLDSIQEFKNDELQKKYNYIIIEENGDKSLIIDLINE
jgi:beta-lactamase superfamily II metal-dependent hydrolase